MDMKELKDKSATELKSQLIDLRREQFNLRMQRGAGQQVKTHPFRQVRRDIARIKMLLSNSQ